MVSGAAPLPRGNHPGAGYVIVKPDYFQAMKTPLRSGRAFTHADTEDAPLVAMINEAFARKHFPGARSDRPAAHDRSARITRRRRAKSSASSPTRATIRSPRRAGPGNVRALRAGSDAHPGHRAARQVAEFVGTARGRETRRAGSGQGFVRPAARTDGHTRGRAIGATALQHDVARLSSPAWP